MATAPAFIPADVHENRASPVASTLRLTATNSPDAAMECDYDSVALPVTVRC